MLGSRGPRERGSERPRMHRDALEDGTVAVVHVSHLVGITRHLDAFPGPGLLVEDAPYAEPRMEVEMLPHLSGEPRAQQERGSLDRTRRYYDRFARVDREAVPTRSASDAGRSAV